MIVEGLAAILQLLCLGLVALLPSYAPPSAVNLSAFQVIAWLVPLGEIVMLGAVMLAGVVASLGYTVINWTLNKVRGAG